MKKEKVIPVANKRTFDEDKGYITVPIEIYVGMPCTYSVGSDRSPAHVSRISESGKTVWIKPATVVGLDVGHDYFSNQKWIIEKNDDAPEKRLHKDKQGNWKMNQYSYVTFGEARNYEDPHF